MPNRLQRLRQLQFRILQKVPWKESLIDGDVDILVNRGRKHEAPKFAIIGRQVRAPAPQRNPQRRSRDDHVPLPIILNVTVYSLDAAAETRRMNASVSVRPPGEPIS